MDRATFQRLYGSGGRILPDRAQIENGRRAVIDWDTYDRMIGSEDPNKAIPKEEALRDIEQLFLLLRYAYSGYAYYAEHTDFGLIQRRLAERTAAWTGDAIPSARLCEMMHEELYAHINDGHVALRYAGFERDLLHSCFPYVTDVLLEERADGYAVLRGCEGLEAGKILQKSEIQAELYPTLSPGQKKKCHLAGCYTAKDPGAVEIGGVLCRTHLLRCCHAAQPKDEMYERTEYADRCVFQNGSYQIYENEEHHLRAFEEAGKSCAGKRHVIWDLSGNRGGNSAYPEAFLRRLNSSVQTEMDTAVVCSPFTGKSDGEMYYRVDKAPAAEDAGTFGGTLYVVMNKETGSSAENAVTFAHSCRNVVKVGSPSAGVGLFGEVRPYRLTHSGIFVMLPYKVFFEEGFAIGRGKKPDYWIDAEDPAGYILQCLAYA